MPLATNDARLVHHPRRIVCLSATTGFIFFLLFVTIALAVTWHRHSQSNNRLAEYTQSYAITLFDELQHTLQPLQAAASIARCDQVRNDLIQRAAFAPNIRAILLVKNGIAFCSSATGPMSVPVKRFSPMTDMSRPLDIRLIPDTPMVPNKPAIALWLADIHHPDHGIFVTLNVNLTPYLLLTSRHLEITGMALTSGERALTTWDGKVVDKSTLPKDPLRTIQITGYPVTLYFYGEILPGRDLHVILLAGLLLSIIITFICFVALLLRQRQGKEIQLGIKRGEFHVEYQPVIEARTGKMYGMEALLRWTHPNEGPIPPDSFIGYAEAQNLIAPLTRHLFSLVARDAHTLSHVIPAGTRLGINLSPLHLSDPGFRDDVRQWLSEMPAGHFDLIFEITERTIVDDRYADDVFDWIRQQNIKIAIDDFGTGHSALIYLEKFKFDYLKIDRGFVQSIGTETVTSPVLDAVLDLAKKLNLNTVAEGVETAEQALWLINGGITYMQGYLFSRPRTVSQLIDYFLDPALPTFCPSRSG